MFNKVRKQLILFNSILMGILLFLFAVTTFAWAAWTVYCGEREDLLAYVKEEVAEEEEESEEEGEDDNDGLMFNYFFDNQGNLIHYSKPGSELSQIADEKIRDWEIGSGKPTLVLSKHANQMFVILLVAQPIKSAAGIHGIFYAGKDVTPHYQFLKKLLYIIIGLLIMFIALITWIGYLMARRAMGPIEHAYQRQREFLADASHELRLPLSVLLSSVEATQLDEENRFSRFSRQVLSDMKDEIKRMSKIIGDLLTLARSDTAVLNLLKERFAIKPVAEEIIRKLYPIAHKKAITLKLDIVEDIVINADKERISQLLVILLDNALKYTPNGGEVRLFIQSPGTGSPELKIIVEDNGIGIVPEEQERIFERFYRVDKTRSREMGGTGLGLPIAKWITESHGGSIRVVSQPSQGSSFLVTLPQ